MKIKIRHWFDNDFVKYSKSGDGKAIPQFELDEKTKTLHPKLDADGKRVTHNLYDDIQKFKDTNSLERILKNMSGDDIESLSIICDSPEVARQRSIDYTKLQDAEKMADFTNKLNKAGLSVDDLLRHIKESLIKSVNKTTPEKKETAPQVDNALEKDVKKDEIKK